MDRDFKAAWSTAVPLKSLFKQIFSLVRGFAFTSKVLHDLGAHADKQLVLKHGPAHSNPTKDLE
jgi:hypothetical protein